MRALLPILVAVLSISVSSQSPPSPAQTETPTFKGRVRVIEVDAIVRDDDDNFVPGLTKDDFVVLEDGQPREIASVSVLNLPVDRRGRPTEAAVPGTAVNGTAPEEMGRVYVLILNSAHEHVRRIAHEFIDGYLGPTDLMAIMHGNRAGTQGLTNQNELLRAAVDRYSGARAGGMSLIKEASINLNALRGRRKAILYIGEDTGIARADGSFFEAAAAQRREYDDALRTAIRNNVRIYAIDPRGFLVRIELQYREGGPAGTGLGEGMHARILASETGGTAIVNTSNYSGGFNRIVRDNSAYYVVAFYSSAEPDGKFHPVKIQVKRPDLSVRAQAGYRAATPDVKGRSVKLPSNISAYAREVLNGSRRIDGGLALDLFTAVYRGEGYEGSLLIGCHVPGAQLKLNPKERIELTYVAVDRWGVTRAAERRAFTLTWSDSARASVAQTGLRLFGRLRLPRGQYDIRVAVHQPGGATGSAFTEIEIPDYTELPISVSDLVVASSHGPSLTTLEDDTILRRALPAQATSNRRFRRAETLSVFGEVYNSQWVLSPKIGVSNLVVSSTGRVVARGDETLVASNRGRVYYNGRVPLAGLDPGEYVMTVEAFTRDGLPSSASRQVRFEVID